MAKYVEEGEKDDSAAGKRTEWKVKWQTEDGAEVAEDSASASTGEDDEAGFSGEWKPVELQTAAERLGPKAEKKIRRGWVAALLSATLALVSPVSAALEAEEVWIEPITLLPALLLYLLAFGLYAKNMVSAMLLLLFAIADIGVTLAAAGGLEAPVSVLGWVGMQAIFAYLYVDAASGIALYHQIRRKKTHKSENPLTTMIAQYLPTTLVLGGVLVGALYLSPQVGEMVFGRGRSFGNYGWSSGGSSSTRRRPATKSAAGGSVRSVKPGGGGASVSSRPSNVGGVPARTAAAAGIEFGAAADDEGCVKESLSRHQGCRDPECYSLNLVFIGACMGKSDSTPGFCDTVPKAGDARATAEWRANACRDAGHAIRHCEELFNGVQYHCENREAGRAAGLAAEGAAE